MTIRIFWTVGLALMIGCGGDDDPPPPGDGGGDRDGGTVRDGGVTPDSGSGDEDGGGGGDDDGGIVVPDASSSQDGGRIACGGFAGLPCPEGLECVDDPSDDCDPRMGGADCIGICQAP